MDHNEAVRLQAAEKYVLGELTQTQREDYEEHYFDCPECAMDVKAVAAFVDASRQVLLTEGARAESRKSEAKEPGKARSGWLLWLRPAFAAPALAVLLLSAVVAYQNTVTIPQAKKGLAFNSGQLLSSVFSLQMANVRGGEGVTVRIHHGEAFALKFDFTPSRIFGSYVCQLRDEAGRSLLQVNVPDSSTNKEAQLGIPGGLVHPGKYSLVFTSTASRGEESGVEVLRLPFSVEFLS